jgi:ABC-type transporter Mla MlaB component
LTIAVDGEFDHQAATTLVRTLDVMGANGVPLFLDLGWVSHIDVEAFCTILSVRAHNGAPVRVIAASAAVARMSDLYQAARATMRPRPRGAA